VEKVTTTRMYTKHHGPELEIQKKKRGRWGREKREPTIPNCGEVTGRAPGCLLALKMGGSGGQNRERSDKEMPKEKSRKRENRARGADSAGTGT